MDTMEVIHGRRAEWMGCFGKEATSYCCQFARPWTPFPQTCRGLPCLALSRLSPLTQLFDKAKDLSHPLYSAASRFFSFLLQKQAMLISWWWKLASVFRPVMNSVWWQHLDNCSGPPQKHWDSLRIVSFLSGISNDEMGVSLWNTRFFCVVPSRTAGITFVAQNLSCLSGTQKRINQQFHKNFFSPGEIKKQPEEIHFVCLEKSEMLHCYSDASLFVATESPMVYSALSLITGNERNTVNIPSLPSNFQDEFWWLHCRVHPFHREILTRVQFGLENFLCPCGNDLKSSGDSPVDTLHISSKNFLPFMHSVHGYFFFSFLVFLSGFASVQRDKQPAGTLGFKRLLLQANKVCILLSGHQ